MRLGSSTLWWRGDDLTPKLLERLAQSGVQAVEVSDYHPSFNYLRAKGLRELGRAARDLGLEIATVHTHIKWHDDRLLVMQSDPVRVRRAVEAYLRAVDALEIVGAKVLLSHDLQLREDRPGRERAQAVEAMREIADYAQSAGMVLALENLPSGWSSKPARLARFVEEAAHPRIKICFDTAHAHRGTGDVPEALRSVAPHVGVFHINDSTSGGDHLLPGEGEIPWVETMPAIQASSPDAHFIYELADESNLSHLQENFEWLMGG